MRKLLAFILAGVMLLSITAASAASGQLVVGSTTELSGDFYTAMWGNNASDASVKALIHGYAFATYTKADGWQIDPHVVAEFTNEGDPFDMGYYKVYTVKLQDDLVWNDGTPITAKDYIFSWLLSTCPEVTALGGDTTGGIEVIGYAGWNDGSADTFRGIHLIDDHTFSIAVDGEYLPFFYELTLIAAAPSPMFVIAPGCDIADDGKGVYITGEFTQALLEKTLLDPVTGYRYNPKVTCGAYSFETFDKVNMQAIMTANPLFKGDYAGDVAKIETIVLKKTLQATQMDELRAGTVDLLSQVTTGDEIIVGQDIVDEGLAGFCTYLRNGFGFFTFSCEEGHPTNDEHVRRAIAYCIDVPEFARAFTKGYGQVVYGYYGAAQWMSKLYKTELAEKMNTYALNLEAAKAELVEGGWIYNEKGEAFVEGTDTLRHMKDAEGNLVPCKIDWASTVDNKVSDLLLQMLPENLAAVGIAIEQTTMQFAELLEYYYQPDTAEIPDGRRGYDMFNLATNFTSVFDPRFLYHTEDRYLGVNNTSGLQDEQLTTLAEQMLNLESTETDKFAEIWFQWQLRWNELMPTVPLYSNEYFDFFNPKLKGLDTDPLWPWNVAILACTIE